MSSEYTVSDWIAFVHHTNNPPSDTLPSWVHTTQVHFPHIRLKQALSVPHCHWSNDSWSLLVIGCNTLRDDFLDAWMTDPLRTLESCPEEFVLLAVDIQRQRCWLGRDAMGFHNAFWTRAEDGLYFSNSLRTLNANCAERPKVAIEHLSEYLSFRYTHAPRTLFKDRFSLIAGHVSIIGSKKSHHERWYRPQWYEMGQQVPTEREALLEIDYLLRRGLEPDLFSGRKMGVLLSGGLDSSAILYHARELGYKLDSFTVTIEGVEADESPFAGRIAHLYDSPNHLLRVNSPELIATLHQNILLFDQPISTPASAIQTLLSQFAHQHVDAVFTGDGGDEVFGGRSMPIIARQMRRSKLIHRLPKASRFGLHRLAKRVGKESWFTSLNQFGLDEEIGGSNVFNAVDRAGLLQDPAYIRPNIRRRILTNLYQEIDSDPINDILYVWQRGWLVEDSLTRIRTIDSSVRFPILNRELREYCAKLPSHYKVRSQGMEFYGKWVLRESMSKRMPKRLLSRPKRTMMAPLDRWLRTDGRSFLAQQVTEITRMEQHIFQPSELHRLYREHANGEQNHGLKLWTLILFHLWYKVHIKGKTL